MERRKVKTSVICTVYNEERSILSLLESLVHQSRPPDEVIIVDGGSTDQTVSLIDGFAAHAPMPIILLIEPGANISHGRNLAVSRASGEIIASTDAGVRLHPDWLAHLVQPFHDADTARVVSGFFLPDPHTTFEISMAATVLPLLQEINPETFLPSSRSVAFSRSLHKQIGGYPEWLDYCEDLIFDIRLKALVGRFDFAPQAIVYFRPRPSLRSFFRQYYHYARGDGKADLWRRRHAIRYGTYVLGIPGILLAGALFHPLFWLGGVLAAYFGLFRTPYRRLLILSQGLPAIEKLKAFLWAPVIRITGDIAKMAGYPAGLRWRWLNRRRKELYWRESA
jgi:glycosyltransferase involved in cell wall biosynthesis